jgi:hypothetical protein
VQRWWGTPKVAAARGIYVCILSMFVHRYHGADTMGCRMTPHTRCESGLEPVTAILANFCVILFEGTRHRGQRVRPAEYSLLHPFRNSVTLLAGRREGASENSGYMPFTSLPRSRPSMACGSVFSPRTLAFRRISTVFSTTLRSTPRTSRANRTVFIHSLASSSE